MIPGGAIALAGGAADALDARAEPQAVPLLGRGRGGAARCWSRTVRCGRWTSRRAGWPASSRPAASPASRWWWRAASRSSLFLRAHGVNIPQLAVLACRADGADGAGPSRQCRRRPLCLPLPAGRRLYDRAGAAHDYRPRRVPAFLHLYAASAQDFRSTTFRPAAPAHYPDAWARRAAGRPITSARSSASAC